MDVHHHAHTARKKWTHYFWEFLMLFLAVFCGFLAEYQLEHKIEKQRAKEYAQSLYRDLTTDTGAYSKNIRNLNICINNIDSLLLLLNNKDEIEKNTTSIYKHGIYAFIFPSNKPNESTLQQLLNSGSLRYFRSSGLIDSVKYYNSVVQLYKDFREDIGSFNIEFRKMQAKIMELDPIITAISRGSFKDLETMVLDSGIFARDTKLLTIEPLLVKEFANWCSLKKFYMANTAAQFNSLKQQAEAVLRQLKKEYHFK
ncbi:MAG TPA: hypothetical protein PKC72_01575 [Chitinophagaceae bacterium]|nr:hypothetical protein [Chitinophagaceae bacterium]